MSFEIIPEEQAIAHTVLNGATITPVRHETFEAETEGWQALDNDQCSPETRIFALRAISDAMHVQAHGLVHILAEGPDSRVAQREMREASAAIALLRLMRLALPLWSQGAFVESDKEYRASPQDKLLMDFHYNGYVDDAHPLIVHRSRLHIPPFNAGELPKKGRTWFINHEHNLYVAAKTPAQATPMLRRDLARSVGSLNAADQLIDRPNSVSLLAYLDHDRPN